MSVALPPPELTRLERLAMEALDPVFPMWSIDALADWLRGYLRREIAKRLRDETTKMEKAPPARTLISEAAMIPDAKALRWVDRIPDERLDDLFAAVAALA